MRGLAAVAVATALVLVAPAAGASDGGPFPSDLDAVCTPPNGEGDVVCVTGVASFGNGRVALVQLLLEDPAAARAQVEAEIAEGAHDTRTCVEGLVLGAEGDPYPCGGQDPDDGADPPSGR